MFLLLRLKKAQFHLVSNIHAKDPKLVLLTANIVKKHIKLSDQVGNPVEQ